MCGRYDNTIAVEAYRRLFGAERMPQSNFPQRYNVAPTDLVPIIRMGEDGQRELVMARWGLVPFWMKDIPKKAFINARAETVATTPMFRDAFAKRRCLIPATGFYEWQQRASGKQPYRIRRHDLEPFAFAGLWEHARIGGEDVISTTIIVCDANERVAPLHGRMPVILEPADYDAWLNPTTPGREAHGLLRPCPAEMLKAYPVSRIVNSPRNDGPECVKAIDDPV
jgi:putative SOS response-associated peptidase YedK